METISRDDFILRNRYDAFCKAVLRNEAKNYLSEMARGCDLHIDNELVAEAFAKLSKTEQSILILTV